MIAVDTSAVMAIVLGETQGEACLAAMAADSDLIMSAATLAELLIVAGHRGVSAPASALVQRLDIRIIPVTEAGAYRAAAAYRRWGKGIDSAGLNFGDCFAYEAAQSHDCGLLFVGADFARTDVRRA